ncbi:uncharacterized protein LOC6733018 [Drosophila simulans]|uniref:Uncharacterized protein, isoform B n=1 Tax=Drosophila simulans TaxID=7240 RepID=A0A0J9R565_DROSI|nr:uncharacterized protein LOC6733018 [Drosophila simulans]XP_016025708.1 uncharacterized protein LOC6733018 [Drosophila simulans]XP_016025709.1 uncharacterized protein LOC6733018 [Drosophila simulans]KMY91253.1 uncharacterized protein Dsimw501_GD24294, isoform B [Drosophila simulans]KMY91254.1 uncharacterized protein Dsimw501_GD24294, isoform C [Drosophila simulans]KMY91255.1 uncharacterized protein Dsimw501_GD24294, isoform D [Drosophila simulans]
MGTASGLPLKHPPTHDHQPRLNEVAQKFLADLYEERQRLSAEFPLCALLIAEAVDRVYGTGRIPGKELDVYNQKPKKITQKVFVSVNQYPKICHRQKVGRQQQWVSHLYQPD